MTTNEKFACARCGFTANGGFFTHLDNCPNHGSSDCPITMGYEDGAECDSCRSDRWYEESRRILSYR